jgi:hypothetical protein
MPYELTINRFCVVPTTPVLLGQHKPLSSEHVIKAFFEQSDQIAHSEEFDLANRALLRSAQKWLKSKTAAAEMGDDDSADSGNSNAAQVVAMRPRDPERRKQAGKGEFETLVALMPYRRLKMRIFKCDWIVRTRASLTGCALHSRTRQTKLWWTIEGIPLAHDRDPSEEAAAEFVKLADAMQAAGMPRLAKAYTRTLADVTGRPTRFDLKNAKRLRISLTDNEAGPVADLLDALRFKRADLADIDNKDNERFERERAGLGEFRKFIGQMSDNQLKVRDDTVETNDHLEMTRGLLCREQDTPSYATFVGGFARAAVGTGFPWRGRGVPEDHFEKFIRLTSPARQLSAELADVEAQALDARLSSVAAPAAAALS